jgi:hypothetical protein
LSPFTKLHWLLYDILDPVAAGAGYCRMKKKSFPHGDPVSERAKLWLPEIDPIVRSVFVEAGEADLEAL